MYKLCLPVFGDWARTLAGEENCARGSKHVKMRKTIECADVECVLCSFVHSFIHWRRTEVKYLFCQRQNAIHKIHIHFEYEHHDDERIANPSLITRYPNQMMICMWIAVLYKHMENFHYVNTVKNDDDDDDKQIHRMDWIAWSKSSRAYKNFQHRIKRLDSSLSSFRVKCQCLVSQRMRLMVAINVR